MFDFKNKVVLITGSRRGIGRGIAECFAEAGAIVVISDIDLKDCENTAREIEKKYKVKTFAVECDVSNKKEVDNMVNKTITKFKQIDVLVNNAGIFFSKPFLDQEESDWDKMMNIDLKGIYLCSQAVGKYMAKRKKGKIINIASIAGLVGYSGASSYCAAKGAIINLTKELAIELAPYNININAVAPGAIETPMTDFIKKDRNLLKQTLTGIPLKRMGEPKDIGYAVLYLSSNEASYITGQTLVVDGGWISQ